MMDDYHAAPDRKYAFLGEVEAEQPCGMGAWRLSVYQCPLCGALVADHYWGGGTAVHEDWHRKQGDFGE